MSDNPGGWLALFDVQALFLHMNSHVSLTRRDALKAIGAGAAFLGLGLPTGQATSIGAKSAGIPQPFTLPELPYAYDALEPHLDARTMEIHHARHHHAYITNANKALAAHPGLQRLDAETLLRQLDSVPEDIRKAVRDNVGGHHNHGLFWRILSPHGGGEPAGRLAAAIRRDFGSFGAFQERFADVAMKRFGSGWAWLSWKNHAAAN